MKLNNGLFLLATLLLPGWLVAQAAPGPDAAPDMQRQFGASVLNTAQLHGFQVRAEQKVEDLAGLLGLLSDTNLDPTLRSEAETAVLRLFADPAAKVVLYDFEQKNRRPATLKKVLAQLKRPGKKMQLSAGAFSAMPPARCQAPECRWEMDFNLTQSVAGQPSVTSSLTVVLILKKTTKNFGGQKMEAWEVLLVDVKERKSRP